MKYNYKELKEAIQKIEQENKTKEQNKAWKIIKDALKVQELKL